MKNKVRIIGGEWRSRQLNFPDVPGLRPTPDRVRESLFNWLQTYVINSRCLDLFAGSGALGLEAASRGAKRVVQVESNLKACEQLKLNVQALSANSVQVLAQDVAQFLQQTPEVFDLVFMDPPFGQNLVIPTSQLLEQRSWLSENAKIYIEVEAKLSLSDLPDTWQLLKNKSAGQVDVYLFQRS